MCTTIERPATNSIVHNALAQRDRILLWAIRAWVVGITQKIPVEEQIQDAFNRIGAPDATGQLYALMWILSQGASRMLDVDCVCRKTISEDERALLDIIALTQHGRSFEAMILLRTMVKSSRALATAECVASIVETLTAAGFILPARRLETSRYAFADRVLGGDASYAPTYH